MIESFTKWRVMDKEFTDYEEAVRYEEASNAIEIFDEQGRPLTLEQAQKDWFESSDFVHVKTKEALIYFEKCLDDFNSGTKSLTIGWNRYDYTDSEWKNFDEEKRIFESNWEKILERIEEE